jgi:molybdenum cofactor cytidylyltransferase
MGRPKQLLSLGNKTVIKRCVDTILLSGVRDIVVVAAGGTGEMMIDALKDLPVKLARNPYAESDMAESARIGLREVNAGSSGIMVCLSDHPMVKAETLLTLIRIHHEDPEKVIIPMFNGRRGHPTLFPRPVIREIRDAPTLRHIVCEIPERIRAVEVPDEWVVFDMDTPEDYRRAMEGLRRIDH